MRFPAVVFTVFLAVPAYAQTPAQVAFNELYACVDGQAPGDCREKITASSVPMYDRFASYGLARCLPNDLQYVSEQRMGDYMLVRAIKSSAEQTEGVRLAFANEGEQMKLDVPQSLQLWLGDNWQSRITTAEQLYGMMRQQFGDSINCDAAKALIK